MTNARTLRAEADSLIFAGNDETERGNIDRADSLYAKADRLYRLARERGEYDNVTGA